MTETLIDLAVRSLAGLVDLDVERTKYRGHARELAAAARVDLIVVLGGDGSINEVVNGVMSWDGTGPGGDGSTPGGDGSTPGGDGSAPGGDGSTPGGDGSTPGGDGSTGEPPLIAVIPGGGA